jgi:dihydrofolate reductase
VPSAGPAPRLGPEDRKRFREVTGNYPVIMGFDTWGSLPRRPLAGRQNIVVSSTESRLLGAVTLATLSDALSLAASMHPGKVFVIGGAALYGRALPVADELHITRVDLEAEGADTPAPAFDAHMFSLRYRTWRAAPGGVQFEFTEYWRNGRH